MFEWKEISSDEERLVEAISIALGRHRYLMGFLFEKKRPRLKDEPQELIAKARGFSRGERLLIRVALDLWCSSGDVRVLELLGSLDDENFENVILAFVFLGNSTTFLAWQECSRSRACLSLSEQF
jgi:hypothetical protein